MDYFDYSKRADPIRDDLVAAHRRTWEHIGVAGTWLNGVERVAIADETRRARGCALCAERKAALSPFAVAGEHDHAGVLAGPLVDVVHRVTTDAGRLTESWYKSVLSSGISAESYVEAVGVAVLVISVDAFHDAMGIPFEPLPEPKPGEPTRQRPAGARVEEGVAWVPVLGPSTCGPEDADLFAGLPPGPAPNVIRALSLVPSEVRAWHDLAAAQYLSARQMQDPVSPRAIDRAQIELLAGRVSALNECFY